MNVTLGRFCSQLDLNIRCEFRYVYLRWRKPLIAKRTSCSSIITRGTHSVGCTHVALHIALAPQHSPVFFDVRVQYVHAKEPGGTQTS